MKGSYQGTATADTEYQAATQAFDNNLSLNNGWHSTDTSSSHWIAFEFPYNVVITSYKIWPRYTNGNTSDIYNPKDWILEGSTASEPSTWYTIDEQENQTDWEVAVSEDDITNDLNYNEYYFKTTPSAFIETFELVQTAHIRGTGNSDNHSYWRNCLLWIHHSRRRWCRQRGRKNNNEWF